MKKQSSFAKKRMFLLLAQHWTLALGLFFSSCLPKKSDFKANSCFDILMHYK